MDNSFCELMRRLIADATLTRAELQEIDRWFAARPDFTPHDLQMLQHAIVDHLLGALHDGTLKMSGQEAVLAMGKLWKKMWPWYAEAIRREERQPEVCFDCRWERVEAVLQKTQRSIDMAMFTLSYDPCRDLLLHLATKKGVKIRIVTDNDTTNNQGSDIRALSKNKKISIITDHQLTLMHHKFAIVDSMQVISGSMNFTEKGFLYNMENFMLSDHPSVVELFKEEFERLWRSFA
jgi:hypothetical protein